MLLGHWILSTKIKKPFRKRLKHEIVHFIMDPSPLSYPSSGTRLISPPLDGSFFLPKPSTGLSPTNEPLTLLKLASPSFTQTYLPRIPSEPRAKPPAQVQPTGHILPPHPPWPLSFLHTLPPFSTHLTSCWSQPPPPSPIETKSPQVTVIYMINPYFSPHTQSPSTWNLQTLILCLPHLLIFPSSHTFVPKLVWV